MKTCRACGVEEQRRGTGREELTNIDPHSGLCLTCLVQSVQARPMPSPKAPIDWARRAAKDED